MDTNLAASQFIPTQPPQLNEQPQILIKPNKPWKKWVSLMLIIIFTLGILFGGYMLLGKSGTNTKRSIVKNNQNINNLPSSKNNTQTNSSSSPYLTYLRFLDQKGTKIIYSSVTGTDKTSGLYINSFYIQDYKTKFKQKLFDSINQYRAKFDNSGKKVVFYYTSLNDLKIFSLNYDKITEFPLKINNANPGVMIDDSIFYPDDIRLLIWALTNNQNPVIFTLNIQTGDLEQTVDSSKIEGTILSGEFDYLSDNKTVFIQTFAQCAPGPCYEGVYEFNTETNNFSLLLNNNDVNNIKLQVGADTGLRNFNLYLPNILFSSNINVPEPEYLNKGESTNISLYDKNLKTSKILISSKKSVVAGAQYIDSHRFIYTEIPAIFITNEAQVKSSQEYSSIYHIFDIDNNKDYVIPLGADDYTLDFVGRDAAFFKNQNGVEIYFYNTNQVIKLDLNPL
jgi:hypothetical protein